MRRIVPLGGGGLADPELLAQILEMTGKDRPRVCYVPTASGDPVEAIEAFHATLPSDRAVATDLALFRMDGRDPRQVLLEQDVIYVGGGSTANMLAVWRVHGVDGMMAEAWESGIVLTGASAGAICWFEDGVNRDCSGRRSTRWVTASGSCPAASARTGTPRCCESRCTTSWWTAAG